MTNSFDGAARHALNREPPAVNFPGATYYFGKSCHRSGKRNSPGKSLVLGIILLAGCGTGVPNGLAQWASPLQAVHDSMELRIGSPAWIVPGEVPPRITAFAGGEGMLRSALLDYDGRTLIAAGEARRVVAGEVVEIAFGAVHEPGVYRIALELEQKDGRVLLDSRYFAVIDPSGLSADQSLAAHIGPDGRMRYVPDYRGNRIPDFSTAGYRGGDKEIPVAPVREVLEPATGDDTRRIQAAIDAVSSLPLDADGIRGAVLLRAGIYEIAGTLRITASGVVLRGEGSGGYERGVPPQPPGELEAFKTRIGGQPGTILLATGEDRRASIEVRGTGTAQAVRGQSSAIMDAYVPVGARFLHIMNPGQFAAGDRILIQRNGNADWISALGMDVIPDNSATGVPSKQWTPRNLLFENRILGIEGHRIELEHRIVQAIEQEWGGGQAHAANDSGRISEVGIEGLRMVSMWTPDSVGQDALRHADRAILINNAGNSWVSGVVAEHFFGAAFGAGGGSRWVTFRDCASLLAHISHYDRVYSSRSGFLLDGQEILIRDVYAIQARHALNVNAWVRGPNVFLNVVAEQSRFASEPHHRWSVGGLFDNVHDEIYFGNRLWYGTGHGWSGANYVAWNTRGTLTVQQPPTAQNWAIGHVGHRTDFSAGHDPRQSYAAVHVFHAWNLEKFGYSDGYWESHGHPVNPASLYLQQLADRQGR